MHDFTVLVLPGSFGTSTAVTLDVLAAAATLAPRHKMPRPTWRVVSPGGGMVPLSNGLQIDTLTMPRRARTDGSTWIVPGLGVDKPADLALRLADDNGVAQ